MINLPINQLRERLEYKDGVLLWKKVDDDYPRAKYLNTRFAGKTAGDLKPNGYWYVSVNGKRLLSHRVIYAMHHGYWPEHTVDHIDGDSTNNKIENLRAVTMKENARNQKLRSTNKSGCMGVRKLPGGTWRVRIGSKHIGCFDCFELAELVYHEAKKMMGYSSDHGVRV